MGEMEKETQMGEQAWERAEIACTTDCLALAELGFESVAEP